MRRITIYIILAGIFSLVCISCQEMTYESIYRAIKKKGHIDTSPLSGESTPVNKDLLGAYIYKKEFPVIVSKVNTNTYSFTFLTTSLSTEDVVFEAHPTRIQSIEYLNIHLYNSFAFMKVSDIDGNNLRIGLISRQIYHELKNKDLKTWLKANPKTEEITVKWEDYVNEEGTDSYQQSVYQYFSLQKITQERAYEIQKKALEDAKRHRFTGCTSITEYIDLKERYPEEDELLKLAATNLYTQIGTKEDYLQFIQYVHYPDLTAKAKKAIANIEIYERAQKEYQNAKEKNTIQAYENFLQNSHTQFFQDSAMLQIKELASKIEPKQIEWAWTSNEKEMAFKLIFYRLKFAADTIDLDWYPQKITLYSLSSDEKKLKQKGQTCLDLCVDLTENKDQLLNLYLYKGFILWSSGEYDTALQLFREKTKENYQDGSTFKSKLKTSYKAFQQQGIVFPEQKNTWKKIKKL